MILHYCLLVLLIIVLSLLILLFLHKPFSKKNVYEQEDTSIISQEELNFIKVEHEKVKSSKNKAYVMCSCKKTFNVSRAVFNKQHTCFMVNFDNGTGTDCKYSCIGLGDCAKVCPQKAISIVNNTAVVSSACIGCGTCAKICPLNIIKLIPADTQTIISCTNCNNDPTSCSDIQKEQEVSWNEKNIFKFWKNCYKIFKNIIKN